MMNTLTWQRVANSHREQALWMGRSIERIIRSRINKIQIASAIAHERRTLENLSDEALRDIGVSRGDATVEARREFFDLPPERLERK